MSLKQLISGIWFVCLVFVTGHDLVPHIHFTDISDAFEMVGHDHHHHDNDHNQESGHHEEHEGHELINPFSYFQHTIVCLPDVENNFDPDPKALILPEIPFELSLSIRFEQDLPPKIPESEHLIISQYLSGFSQLRAPPALS